MHARSPQRMPTFEELYEVIRQLPEGMTGEILDEGEIGVMGRPGRPHRVASRVVTRMIDAIEREHRWVFEVEAEIRFGDRLAVPDVAGWRLDQEGTGFLSVNPITRVPDWTCEILSDSTARKDRLKKLPLFAEHGVVHAWLIDPAMRLVEVYSPRDGVPALVASAGDGQAVLLPPFDLDFDVAALWRDGGNAQQSS